MRIREWSSYVGSTDLEACTRQAGARKSAGAVMALAGIAAVAGGGVLREQAFSMGALATPAANSARRHDVGSRIRTSPRSGFGFRAAVRRHQRQGIAAGRMRDDRAGRDRSEEHTSELQSLMRISYAVFCLKKKKKISSKNTHHQHESMTQKII